MYGFEIDKTYNLYLESLKANDMNCLNTIFYEIGSDFDKNYKAH